MFYDGDGDTCRCKPYVNADIPSRCTACATCRGRTVLNPDGSGCGCTADKCKGKCDMPGCTATADQRRIWKQSRTSSSSYVAALSALTVPGGLRNRPKARFSLVNWNQASDRAVPGVGTAYIPTRGSTTRGATVSNKPGGGGYAGVGVDIKHGSYDRYLARLKAASLRSEPSSCDGTKVGRRPRTGNKRRMIGMIAWASRQACCTATRASPASTLSGGAS